MSSALLAPTATRQSPPDPLATLNPEQRSAAEHGVGAEAQDTRPLLVIAGAGSGKTNTLAHRVANLILHKADPQGMLLLTFSRRAAAEMERRAGLVLQRVMGTAGKEPPRLPWAGTFHSIGARLLREYAGRIGLDESFTIHDRGDAEDLLGLVRHELGFDTKEKRFPRKETCLSIYSRAVNTQAPLTEILQRSYTWCSEWEGELKRLFAMYVEAKQEQNVLDYDDLLLYWAEMMSEPTIASDLSGRFDHVLVDEYQDTNHLQALIIRGLKPTGQGVTVVGDDAQSIYSFRGATVRNILDFPNQFRQEARVVTLDRNYRSTQPILDASNAVIAEASERYAKLLHTDKMSGVKPELVLVPDEAGEARWVAERILEHREAGLALKSQAVLFRTASHSAALELELMRRDIPFIKFGGLKFLEAAHIKDMLAILRFAQNPRGRMAGFRVLQLIPGIGPATATRLLEIMSDAPDPVTAVAQFEVSANAAQDWKAFADLYQALASPDRDRAEHWVADLEQALRWYTPHLERLHDDAQVRRGDLEQLVRLASGYGSRERFLAELTLDPPESTGDLSGPPHRDEDYLILSTIHSAKGQEWTSVHVLHAVDGCIPADLATGSAAEIEEERRLLYVAMTRAKDHLHLMVPQRFYITQQNHKGDRHLYAPRTRFITDRMLGHFKDVTWPQAEPGARSPGGPAQTPAMSVRDRARAAWR